MSSNRSQNLLDAQLRRVRDLQEEDRGPDAEAKRREAIRAAESAGDFEAWSTHKIAEFKAERTYFNRDLDMYAEPDESSAQMLRFTSELPAEWEREQRHRAEVRKKRRQDFLEAMPLRAAEFAIKATTEDPLIKRVSDWAKKTRDDGGIAVLSGPAGVGKTVAACWWADGFPRVPMFMRASEFATMSRYDQEGREQWQRQHALILDDLGAEYLDPKGSFLVDLDELIDIFYAGKKYLVITTNCDKATFKARYGNRIVDRLAEVGTWIAVPGESRRKKAKAE
jgi:DNA replication protein DnaC